MKQKVKVIEIASGLTKNQIEDLLNVQLEKGYRLVFIFQYSTTKCFAFLVKDIGL